MKLSKDRFGEWPIVSFWYTQKKGQSIEHIIDTDVSFFEWAVMKFQNVTPAQAAYYEQREHKKLPKEVIQDVTPYQWEPGDLEKMYMEICYSQDLDGTLNKYRGVQFKLF